MKRADLAVGDMVYVVLPYDGGRGYATIVDLDATPGPHDRPSYTIEVDFVFPSKYLGKRKVSATRIVRRGIPCPAR